MRSCLLVLLVLAAVGPGPAAAEIPVCVVYDIAGIGWERLSRLQSLEGTQFWLELDSELAVCGDASLQAAAPEDRILRAVAGVDPLRLRLGRALPDDVIQALGAEVIARGGSYAFLNFSGPAPPAVLGPGEDEKPNDWQVVLAVPENAVLARQEANRPERSRTAFDETIGDLVDQVDAQRWFDDIVSLASFNRYTYSPDVLNARDWLVHRFEAVPGLVVTTDTFDVGGTTAYNVVATRAGISRPDDWYIVGGHYDATSEDPYTAAPGAEDNASGCAGVLELARIFSSVPAEATVLFICYSGEEQGLFGSRAHVDALVASGDITKVQSMLDMDMIGYTIDAHLDCLLETEPFASFLLDLYADAAADYTTLSIVTSTWAWGSDHVPYLNAGVPALLTIENDWDQYPDYHRTTDLPANITLAMGEGILRMNVAAFAQLIGAETGLVFHDSFESGDLSGW
jgi:hypothetical protein